MKIILLVNAVIGNGRDLKKGTIVDLGLDQSLKDEIDIDLLLKYKIVKILGDEKENKKEIDQDHEFDGIILQEEEKVEEKSEVVENENQPELKKSKKKK